jgi:glycosyltransferase involved in cell wall biosynthesis
MEQQDKHTGDQHPTVVHAINNLDVGGVETMALETIRQFQDWGKNRLVVVDGRRQPRRPAFDELGIPVSVWDHRPGEYTKLIWKSFQYFRGVDADALLCWSYGNHAFLSTGARLAGVPKIAVSVQNAPPINGLPLWKWRALGWLGILVSDKAISCSNYVRQQINGRVGLPGSYVKTVYNGCDVNRINKLASRSQRGSSAGPIIGMVARLNRIKDHSTLIRAMPRVISTYPDAELWLIGDGERREELEDLSLSLGIGESIKFWGNRDDVASLLGFLDVFAFSTTPSEGFGIALIESLSARVPVVATDVGPCTEVLKNGEWGYLVDEGDASGLAKTLCEVIADSDPRLPRLREVSYRFGKRNTASEYFRTLLD